MYSLEAFYIGSHYIGDTLTKEDFRVISKKFENSKPILVNENDFSLNPSTLVTGKNLIEICYEGFSVQLCIFPESSFSQLAKTTVAYGYAKKQTSNSSSRSPSPEELEKFWRNH